jgi:hypothetical protein
MRMPTTPAGNQGETLMSNRTRGRLASVVAFAILPAAALAGGSYSSPVIEAVVVMDDIDAIAIVGRNLPVMRRDMSVRLGPDGEPGDISAQCQVASPLSRAITCRFSAGLPPAGDYLLRVANTRANTSTDFAVTIGAVGPQGPRGEAGAVGPAGPRGAAGESGSQGPQGPRGEQGVVGPAGPVGATGATGQMGPSGPTGADGPMGPPGLTGAAGPTGPVGIAGPAGATGPAGADGTPGAQGPVGPAGPAGSDGLIGPAGPVGPMGPVGPTGPMGPRGFEGNSQLSQHYGANTGTARHSRGYDCVLGAVQLTASFSRGEGMPALGQLLPIMQYAALYSLIGITYGGDGRTTFALPDLRPITPNNMTYSICVEGIYPTID